MKLHDKAWLQRLLPSLGPRIGSWRSLQYYQLAVAAIVAILAWEAGVTPGGMVDMLLLGANLAGAWYSGQMVKQQRSFDAMVEAFGALTELQQVMMDDRATFKERRDDSPPTQPRLH